MSDDRTAAERYRDQTRGMDAVGFCKDVNPDGTPKRVYRGPRGESGAQPIYRGQVPERQGNTR